MDSLRERNFFIDIRGLRKLRDENIYNFIAKNLKLTPTEVAAIQIDRIEGKVFVELRTQDAVQKVVDEFDDKFTINNNGATHHIRLYVEDGGTDVTLHHLPPNMPEEWIREYLVNYGDIISIKQEMCPTQLFSQTPSGIRNVRIRMTSPIPSFVNIKGYSSHVTYTNQIQTCRHCNQEVHFGASCSENRAKLAHRNKSSLYSKVLAQPGGLDRPGEQPAPVELAPSSQLIQPALQQQSSTQSQNTQQLFKRPGSPSNAESREKTVKTSSTDTIATTAAAMDNSKAAKGHDVVSSMSDRSRSSTSSHSRSNSLSKKSMEISDDEFPGLDDGGSHVLRSSKNKHKGK